MFMIIAAVIMAVVTVATAVYTANKQEEAAEKAQAAQSSAEKKAIEQAKVNKKITKMHDDAGTKKLASQLVAATGLEKLKADRSTRIAGKLHKETAELGGNQDLKKTPAPGKAYFTGSPATTH